MPEVGDHGLRCHEGWVCPSVTVPQRALLSFFQLTINVLL